MIRRTQILTGLFCSALVFSAMSAAPPAEDPAVKAFEALAEKIQTSPETATEADVTKLLTDAKKLGRPFKASVVVKGYFDRHPGSKAPLPLLRQAAGVARLAGDYTTAVSRYKSYLKQAGGGNVDSETAADLYMVLIDFQQANDDAFQFIDLYGGKFLATPRAKQYWYWFTSQAQGRRDYAALARGLAGAMALKLPLAEEQFWYWDNLAFLNDQLATVRDTKLYSAAPVCRQVAPLIRGNKHLALQFAFRTENLAYLAAIQKETDAKEMKKVGDAAFPAVRKAADAYLSAYPTAETVTDIFRSLLVGGGYRNWRDHSQGDLKRQWFKAAFAKLPVAEQRALVSQGEEAAWRNPTYILPGDWAELMLKFPVAFKDVPGTRYLTVQCQDWTPQQYAQLGKALQGTPSEFAAVINSIAAGSNDLNRAIAHLMTHDSWYLPSDRFYPVLSQRLWPVYSEMHKADKLPGDYWPKAFYYWTDNYVVKSPLVLLDPSLARMYLTYAWSYGGKDSDDKSHISDALAALDWAPYDAKTRAMVISGAYGAFKKWAGGIAGQNARTTAATRKQITAVEKELGQLKLDRAADRKTLSQFQTDRKKAAGDKKKLTAIDQRITTFTKKLSEYDEKESALNKTLNELQAAEADADAAAKQISTLETAFKRALAAKGDSAKAPTPMCKALAQAVVALQNKKADDYAAAARQLYKMVREYDVKKIPYGEAIMDYVMANREPAFDTFDLQCEFLADQLTTWNPRGDNARVVSMFARIAAGRKGWNTSWTNIPEDDIAKARKLNDILAKALTTKINKGQFRPELFSYFLATRSGRGWQDHKTNNEVMVALITKKTFLDYYDKLGYSFKSAPHAYTYLINTQFPELTKKYPPKFFKAMFLEEASKTKFVDTVWINSYARDEIPSMVDALAGIFLSLPAYPFGYEENAEAIYTPSEYWALFQIVLQAKPQMRQKVLDAIEAEYGKTRFDSYAAGYQSLNDMSNPSAGQPGPETPKVRKEYFAKLAEYVQHMKTSAGPLSLPSLTGVARIRFNKLTDEEFAVLNTLFTNIAPAGGSGWSRAGYYFDASQEIYNRLLPADGEPLFALIPQLWRIAKDQNNTQYADHWLKVARELENAGKMNLAAAFSYSGLNILGNFGSEDLRGSLASLQSKVTFELGGLITVPRADPRYPAFAAQAEYLLGRPKSAWEMYLRNRKLITSLVKELDPRFVIWLVQRHTDEAQYDQAESLGRLLLSQIDTSSGNFDPALRADMLLAYADIAFHRKEYPRARAQYERIATAKEYKGTRAQDAAMLKIAEVDRLTRQFDQAMDRLEKLARSRDRSLQAEANYQIALVKFDQDDYEAADQYVQEVLSRRPDHAEAKILEGRINLKRKKLTEATKIKVGLSASQRYLVPGKPLKVDLEDRNLSIVGGSGEIEIRAWTASGDEETFLLLPFGDSKTEFEGQVITELGAASKGDRILQVVGGDKVYYDFSPRYRESHNIKESAPPPLTVVTDGELYVSSGKILSKEELQQQAMEDMIRRRLRLDDKNDKAALSTVRPSDQVKPGNPVNIRVMDADRSTTGDKDSVIVSIKTTNGDSIDRVVLTETEPHSGVFEGSAKSGSAQATAYASDSDEGREANAVISAGDHGPWVALPDNAKPKMFVVDLNDNVALGKMTIQAGVPGRKLKDFFVQTSMNGKTFESLGRYGKPFTPWNGALTVELVRYEGSPRDLEHGTGSLPVFQRVLTEDYLRGDYPKFSAPLSAADRNFKNLKTLKFAWPNYFGQRNDMRLYGNANYILHVYGAFYCPERMVRQFRLDTTATRAAILAVDGQVDREDPTQFEKSFAKGVHRVDIYLFGNSNMRKGSLELLCDTDKPPYMESCPLTMFDTKAHPQIAEEMATSAATITANDDGTAFDVTFPEGARARAIRLLIADYETDAPAINKINLTSADGKQILPTREDYRKLRTNDVLEIVPGDTLTVSYNDPTVISKDKKLLQKSLQATYSNAELDACFVEYTPDGKGGRKAQYIPMRRFQSGDAVVVFINDPDGDVSDEADILTFTAKATSGKPRTVKALETDAHSGIFVAKIFPVKHQPKRDVEIQLADGDDLELAYMDQENTDPGIPWRRTVAVEQAVFKTPELRVYNVTSQKLSPEEITAAAEKAEIVSREDFVSVTRMLVASYPEKVDPNRSSHVLVGGPVFVEVLYPTAALSPKSTVDIYAQTSAGRKRYGRDIPAGTFDINVPGTIKLTAVPSNVGRIQPPVGYRNILVRGSEGAVNPLEDGRFSFNVPVTLGELPEKSLATNEALKAAEARGRSAEPVTLNVTGGDDIYVGFKYTDPNGIVRWETQRVVLDSDAFFDIMDRHYQQSVDGIHVGESLYLRLIDKGKDISDEMDAVRVSVVTKNGQKMPVELRETFSHSGVFKGVLKLAYAGEKTADDSETLGVVYGDQIDATYLASEGGQSHQCTVVVFKGADGKVLPFTKRFADPAIAVKTQFTIAESYFELAKKHRELNQESLARREIAQGKKLLEEAIRDNPNNEALAQAKYLLANLAFELANDSENELIQRRQYMEAINGFSDLVASYPDSPYAPKAQYKKALVYEKMGEIDKASEEYVKLSYRYPSNELVAETIARLGQYFMAKGKAKLDEADKTKDPVQKEKIKLQAREMYRTAGQVLQRLAVRFPTHKLAEKSTLVAGTCFMESEDYDKAIEIFQAIIDNKGGDKDIVAESMFWAGTCYLKEKKFPEAYRMYKNLTWDYPASKWAKFARGRLLDDRNLVRQGENDAK